jgi:hypothetical protein
MQVTLGASSLPRAKPKISPSTTNLICLMRRGEFREQEDLLKKEESMESLLSQGPLEIGNTKTNSSNLKIIWSQQHLN